MLRDRIWHPLLVVVGLAVAPGTAVSQQAGLSMEDIPWEAGPTVGKLGTVSQVSVPEGCMFTGEDGTKLFMELTENTSNPGELGVLLCRGATPEDDGWFVVFTYDPVGYVKDDERGTLDAGNILASLRKGQDAANRQLQDRGWATLTVERWLTQPYYDSTTHNLTWATLIRSSDGGETANHSVRLLGRGGVMHVDLVAFPQQLPAVMPTFEGIVAEFVFLPGHRYAEWRQGDRVAKYGLTGLIIGGGLVAAAKTGLLARLWKVLVVAAVGAASALKRLFGGKRPAAAAARG